jgi:orotate phosphoribosyltransferase
MLTRKELLDIFAETGVLLQGHFLLTSGKHSPHYLQCARVLQYPHHAAALCADLAAQFSHSRPELCVGPALGGVIMAYETARNLGVRGLFAEREKDGSMALRRGFTIDQGERVLVLEDVVTTGGSVMEVINLVRQMGANVVGVGAVVDRSSGKADFGVPFKALISLEAEAFSPEECPLCRQGIPAVKPGSKK